MVMRYYAPLPGGDPFWPRGPHAMRVGDAERDAAAADLGEHYTAGRLTLEELHERLEAVFAAKTFGQLARILSDLPGQGRLAGLTRSLGPPMLPGTPALPWMPTTGPRYHWGGYWDPNSRHGVAMGPTANGFSPGEEFGPSARFRSRGAQPDTPHVDRTAKFAALSLLILAMLIWLFTALVFAKHGFSAPLGPGNSFSAGR
jgi:Domain of unknown function (DUF1707)